MSKGHNSVAIVLPEDESQSPITTPARIRHNGEVLEGYVEVITTEQELQALVRFEGLPSQKTQSHKLDVPSPPSPIDARCIIGYSRTWMRPENSGLDNTPISTGEHKFLSQLQEVSSNDCPPGSPLESGRYCYNLPFRFVIPNRLVSPSLSEMFLNLPPSYKGGFACHYQANGQSFMQPLIGYTIHVVVMLKGANGRLVTKGICSSTRDIFLKPFNSAAPPLEISDLRGDYRLSSTMALKKSLWSKSLGHLEVSAIEPRPLNMLTKALKSTSIASLKFTFTPLPDHALRVRPFEWVFQIETKILALTFYSTRLLKQEPSLEEVKTNPLLRVNSSVLNLETRIINDASWGHRRLSPHGIILSSQTPSWNTQFDIPINTPKNLLPTFLSPLASRRYALRVIVDLVGMHHSSLELQVPLQVNLEPPSSDDSGVEGSTSADDNVSHREDIAFSRLSLADSSSSPPPYRR